MVENYEPFPGGFYPPGKVYDVFNEFFCRVLTEFNFPSIQTRVAD